MPTIRTLAKSLKVRRQKLREKRFTPLLKIINTTHEKHGHVNIIDIGGTEEYWQIISKKKLEENHVIITIVNLPKSHKPKDHGPFKFIIANACDLKMFQDKSFHIAHSNSVIEHVGNWEHMVQYAHEVSRVAEKYFIQTPNYWFPVEPHFMAPLFHWLPKPTRIWILLRSQLGYWKKATSLDEAMRIDANASLLSKKMFQELFKDSHIITERFFGLAKSFIAIKK